MRITNKCDNSYTIHRYILLFSIKCFRFFFVGVLLFCPFVIVSIYGFVLFERIVCCFALDTIELSVIFGILSKRQTSAQTHKHREKKKQKESNRSFAGWKLIGCASVRDNNIWKRCFHCNWKQSENRCQCEFPLWRCTFYLFHTIPVS